MDEENVLVGSGLGRKKVFRGSYFAFEQAIMDQAVLLGREDVLADGEVVAVAVDQFERKHGKGVNSRGSFLFREL